MSTSTSMLAAPEAVDAEIVCLCCMEVAAWARRTGAPLTALTYAQAAALITPAWADPAILVGICAREAGQGERAEGWLRRAAAVARREKDGGAPAAAYAALGQLFRTQEKNARTVPDPEDYEGESRP